MKYIFTQCPFCGHDFEIDTQEEDENKIVFLTCPKEPAKYDRKKKGCGLQFPAFNFDKSKIGPVWKFAAERSLQEKIEGFFKSIETKGKKNVRKTAKNGHKTKAKQRRSEPYL